MFHLLHEDQVFFEREKDAIIANAQTVFASLAGQFLYIALQPMLEYVETVTDPATLIPGQCVQLRSASSPMSSR